MRARLITCLGIFSVMALSNAVVPLLPSYAPGSSVQGAIYAAYFFGAFLLTLPAGILADRFGRIAILRSGLFITVLSGIVLCFSMDPAVTVAARLIEGCGAGLFVTSALAYINSLPDHGIMSGYYMASLNTGLVVGLAAGGFLAVHIAAASGIVLFTGACFSAAVLSMTLSEPSFVQSSDPDAHLGSLIRKYRWFWISAIVLIGATGVVTSQYPSFSPAESDIDSIWIAGMSVSTTLASLIVSRIAVDPMHAIRAGGVTMAAGVIFILYSPAGFVIVGAAAGVVMIAQMDLLSHASRYQGAAMGLFSTTSYLGMSILPLLSGILTDLTGYTATFLIVAGIAFGAAIAMGRLPGRKCPGSRQVGKT